MKDFGLGSACIRGWLLAAITCFWTVAAVADHFLPFLETRTGVYSNVTVTLKTARDVHIRHDRGIANIDLNDLDTETKAALGYQVELGDQGEGEGISGALPADWRSAFDRARGTAGEELPFEIPTAVSTGFIMIALMVGLLFHIFFSYCSRLICIKTGNDPGFMIWLPVFQIFPMLQAAGMSGWWFLGLFVPVFNIVVQIIWCVKIVNARGKHVIWTILLIVPLLNLIAFLYLAFSDDGGSRGSLEYPAYSPTPV